MVYVDLFLKLVMIVYLWRIGRGVFQICRNQVRMHDDWLSQKKLEAARSPNREKAH